MIRQETGFKIIKYKGKAISVAMCGLFCLLGSGGASAGNSEVTVANSPKIIADGDTPVFTEASGTATVANTVNLSGNATTLTSGVGTISFLGATGSMTSGSMGTSSLRLGTLAMSVAGTQAVTVSGGNVYVTAITAAHTSNTLNITATNANMIFDVSTTVAGAAAGTLNISGGAASVNTAGFAVTSATVTGATTAVLNLNGGAGGISNTAATTGGAGGAVGTSTFAAVTGAVTLTG